MSQDQNSGGKVAGRKMNTIRFFEIIHIPVTTGFYRPFLASFFGGEQDFFRAAICCERFFTPSSFLKYSSELNERERELSQFQSSRAYDMPVCVPS